MDFQRAKLIKPRKYTPYHYNPEPADWNFANKINWNKPIIVEIGCGKGHWIINQAKKNPDKEFIAIERTQNKSKTLLKQSQKLNLKNLFAIRADAIPLLYHKFKPQSVSEFYFFYPNPTPKKKQSNQRFFTSSAFFVLDTCLKINGKVYLVSNIKDYIEEAKDFLNQIWKYKIKSCCKTKPKIPRTDFEKKYLGNNETLYEVFATKI